MSIFTHRRVSILKSFLRMAAYAAIMASTHSSFILKVFCVLVIAEMVGIAEEFFE